jgi:hypothetical protein
MSASCHGIGEFLKNPRIVRIFMDYTGSGELKSVLIHVIRGPCLVIFKGNNYISTEFFKGDVFFF